AAAMEPVTAPHMRSSCGRSSSSGRAHPHSACILPSSPLTPISDFVPSVPQEPPVMMSENFRPRSLLAAASFLSLAAATAAPALADVRYVNANLPDGGDNGTSWADAYRGVDALA